MKLHITEKAINDFVYPQEKKQVLLFDQEQTGFAVSITRAGAKSYIIIYTDVAGKQRQEKLATVGAVSAQAARAMATIRLAMLASLRGASSRARRSSCPSMDTFFYDTFLPIVKNTSRSYETHASIYRNHVGPVFGQKRLDEISEHDIVAFNTLLRHKLVANGRWAKQATKRLADGTVKRILILVRHIFNVAIKDKSNTLRDNPTHVLQLTTVRTVKGRFLTQQQLTTLLRVAETSPNASLADITRVMGATGLRRENVLAMKWKWFDDARGTLTVPVGGDKAKTGFVLHLSAGVLALLRGRLMLADGPWVFPNPKTGKPFYSCRNAWVTTTEKAKMPGLRMHDLRHTYASMMLDSGSDIVDVQHALGHTQLKTTAIYLHLREARKRVHADAAAMATGLFA